MRTRGFTLIEMMVVIAITGLLLASGAPMVAEMRANSQIRGVAEQVRDGLNTARMEAIRRNTTINFVPNGTGWSVVAPAVGATAAVTLVTRTPYAAESAFAATPNTTQATTPIAFNGSGRITTAVPSNVYTIQVTQPDGTCVAAGGNVRCLNVKALKGGEVRMCDPAQASSKPEGC